MTYITRAKRPVMVFVIWITGLLLYLAMGYWNVEKSREEYAARLVGEAGQVAGQLASLLSLPAWELDEMSAHIVVSGAMEDERIYAISIQGPAGLLDGQRRNYLWEPVPWDGELTENCVQGIAPIRVGGQMTGRLEIWLSPRLGSEELAILTAREGWRFCLGALFWTSALGILLWYWGDLRRLARIFSRPNRKDGEKGECPERIMFRPAGTKGPDEGPDDQLQVSGECNPVNEMAGRRFQRKSVAAWPITACLFRHTFSQAPALIDRLYSDGCWAQLCHVGRLIEQAAPLVGAATLADAAMEMQRALNDPQCETAAHAADKLCQELKSVLLALGSDNGVG